MTKKTLPEGNENPDSFPWHILQRQAVQFGLSLSDFWQATPAEIIRLMHAQTSSENRLSRAVLNRLIENYPDSPATGSPAADSPAADNAAMNNPAANNTALHRTAPDNTTLHKTAPHSTAQETKHGHK